MKKRITIDFDFTLSLNDGSLNVDTMEKLLPHFQKGDDMFIVTSRMDSEKSRKEIENFLLENKLAVNNIFHTSGPKIDKLLELKSDIHFDDDKRELDLCKRNNIKTMDCWNDQLYIEQWRKEFGEDPLEVEQ